MVVAVAVLFSVAGFAHFGADRIEGSVAAPPLFLSEVYELSDGDLVFRTGRDMMARLVLSQGESARFSHVGIIVRRARGVFVVHALPHDATELGGVLMQPLSVFAASDNAADLGFYRVKGIDAKSKQKLRNYALHQVGKAFDEDFRFSDDAGMYCTELALKALSAGGIDILSSVQSIGVMTLAEPVFPPDYLRRSIRLEPISPKLLSRSLKKTDQ